MFGELMFLSVGETITVDFNKLFGSGRNAERQLALAFSFDPYNTFTDQELNGEVDWASYSCGTIHTVAIKSDGTLWGTGGNTKGELGLGDTTQRDIFTKIGTDTDWAFVSCGNGCTVAIKSNGTMWVSGNNEIAGGTGRIGLGATLSVNVFTQIGTDTDWSTAAASSSSHTVAIKTTGTMWSTGDNFSGQLAVGDTTSRTTFTQEFGLDTDWSSVSCGTQTIAIKTTGTLYGAGSNFNGRLGLGGDTSNRIVMTQISASTDWESVACNGEFSVAIRTPGTIWSTGLNADGQLGQGDNVTRTTFGQVGSDTNWSVVSVGGNSSIAVKSTGTMWSTGDNVEGQLGLGDDGTGTDRNSFTQVGVSTGWTNVEVGTRFAMANDFSSLTGTV